MRPLIISLLIIIAISHAMDWCFDLKFCSVEDASHRKTEATLRHAVTPSSINYDVHGLDELVGRLRLSKLADRQARAYANIYGISDKDLVSHYNIFGERE